MVVHELSGSADLSGGGDFGGPPCQHPEVWEGNPDVGVVFCPACGCYLRKSDMAVIFTAEEMAAAQEQEKAPEPDAPPE